MSSNNSLNISSNNDKKPMMYSTLAITIIVISVVIIVALVIFLAVWFTLPSKQSSDSSSNNNLSHKFMVTDKSNAFSYISQNNPTNQINVSIEPGYYYGWIIAKNLEKVLNASSSDQNNWTVIFNPSEKTFSISSSTFLWSRCDISNSIYNLIGFISPVNCGKNNSWVKTETGSPSF